MSDIERPISALFSRLPPLRKVRSARWGHLSRSCRRPQSACPRTTAAEKLADQDQPGWRMCLAHPECPVDDPPGNMVIYGVIREVQQCEVD